MHRRFWSLARNFADGGEFAAPSLGSKPLAGVGHAASPDSAASGWGRWRLFVATFIMKRAGTSTVAGQNSGGHSLGEGSQMLDFAHAISWFTRGAAAVAVSVVAAFNGSARGAEYLSGIDWPAPPVVTPGDTDRDPPSDAVVLFGGEDAAAWNGGEKWTVADGELVVGKGMIQTKQTFGDCQLHIEWSAPTPATGAGQQRGNSGVFFGPYEIQILDCYENTTYFDGQAAAIYKQHPPLANAMRKPGDWNSYDIIWRAPRFRSDGSLEQPAAVTVLHNGVLVQNHFELLGDTPYNRPPRYQPHPATLPIRLQDHGNPVRFRNIWVREIEPAVGKRVRPPSIREGETTTPIPEKSGE